MNRKNTVLVLLLILAVSFTAFAGGSRESGAEGVTISIWHGFIETEEALFSQAVNNYMAENPNVTIEMLAVPFDQLVNKFTTEVSSGTGPTLIVGPQDRMANYEEAGLLAALDQNAPFLKELVPAAVEGGKIGGNLVGVPVSNKVVALYYNKTMISKVPANFNELLSLTADHGMAITLDWFHNYMWGPAFGATFLNADNKVVIDSPQGAAAYGFLKKVSESRGVVMDGNDGDMDTLFRQGKVAFRIQGPWAAGDIVKDLGAGNVGVMAVPAIEGKNPRPWNQSEMISVSVDATDAQMDAAMDFLAYFTGADVQKTFLEEASWIPANASVDTSSNPVVGGFLLQVAYSDPFPVVSELGSTWEPMGNAMTKIMEGVASPAEALKEAAALANTANGK